MYVGDYARSNPERPAIIMANSGEVVSYRAFDQQTNQLAHFLRDNGLQRLDHYAIFMENNSDYLLCCGAGERSGLYFTCVNSYLNPDELAYIINNSESKVLITSLEKFAVAEQALKHCPAVNCCLVVGMRSSSGKYLPYEQTLAGYPTTPIADEYLGTPMLYSSGTTGRPKGVLRPLDAVPPSQPLSLATFLTEIWLYRPDMVYLSPAPLYHSAPQMAVGLTIRQGGTCVIMERFDPQQYLSLIGKYGITHTQLVPTMFSRLLKLSDELKKSTDLSSLKVVVHAAAPCPVPVKQAMIDWWGPIIHEYYGATEGLGFATLDSHEWLQHRGSVGKVVLGKLHILDANGDPNPAGKAGEIWFETANPFSYFNNPEKTREAMSDDGAMSTVGDIGYLSNGYLYLTDRSTFMIISGGVNIYPQETENLLIVHAKVCDAAVFGVPNEDLGEEVKAVVQVMPEFIEEAGLESELMAYCYQHLSRHKCPRSIDFVDQLPRLPTGKLYKKTLKDSYWIGHRSSSAP